MFQYIADQCLEKELAWDCATGSGQAAVAWADFFKQVIATDASRAQVEKADKTKSNVEYKVMSAEKTTFKSNSFDLVSVAQALHWFDQAAFFEEARRVLKPAGIIAVWTYGLHQISEAIDSVCLHFYENVVGPYWPPERRLVEEKYRNTRFDFKAIEAPVFTIIHNYSRQQLLGYLRSWSSVQRYIDDRGENPLKFIEADLQKLWPGDETKEIRWPITLLLGRK